MSFIIDLRLRGYCHTGKVCFDSGRVCKRRRLAKTDTVRRYRHGERQRARREILVQCLDLEDEIKEAEKASAELWKSLQEDLQYQSPFAFLDIPDFHDWEYFGYDNDVRSEDDYYHDAWHERDNLSYD